MRFPSPRNFYAGAALLFFSCLPSFANNLEIGTVSFENQTATTLDISFTVSQSNTYCTSNAYSETVQDCVWIFIKYSLNGEAGPWNHCIINGISSGDDPDTVRKGVEDGRGLFIFRNKNASYWTSRNVKARWLFSLDGLTQAQVLANARFRVFGIEMVYISTGAFVYNAGGIGGDTCNNYFGGGQIAITEISYVPPGCGNSWPNGYRAFFCAKYEVSQAQYVQFLNSVDPEGSSGTTYYDSSLYNTMEYYIQRDNSRPVGDRYYVAAGRETLGCNYLSWDDCRRYASWCGMRPMTEMEFERAARGGGTTNTNAYPWGNADPRVNNSTETKSGTTYDCWLHYANFADGSGAEEAGYDGPTPVGHYLSGLNISGAPQARTAAQTGASPYGIADMVGNLWEQVINCEWTKTPSNGNGTTVFPASTASRGWPDAAAGKGLRGGGLSITWSNIRISDRGFVSNTLAGRYSNYGFRPARTP